MAVRGKATPCAFQSTAHEEHKNSRLLSLLEAAPATRCFDWVLDGALTGCPPLTER